MSEEVGLWTSQRVPDSYFGLNLHLLLSLLDSLLEFCMGFMELPLWVKTQFHLTELSGADYLYLMLLHFNRQRISLSLSRFNNQHL